MKLQLIVIAAILIVFRVFLLSCSLFTQTDRTHASNQPVLDYGAAGQWDSGTVFFASVIKDGDTLRMWYTGFVGGPLPQNRGQIGYAWSVDGVAWTRYAGNPVLSADLPWEGITIAGTSVIKDGDSLKMWYGAAGAPGRMTGYATSSDGIRWNKHPDPVFQVGTTGDWDDSLVGVHTVIKEDSLFKMWYFGARGSFPINSVIQIGFATSTDGIDWIKYDDPSTTAAPFANSDPVLKVGASGSWEGMRVWTPSVLPTEDGYEMWYSGAPTSLAAQWIGYATSQDGIMWTKWPTNPIFDTSPAWGFQYLNGTILKFDGLYHHWYSSFDASGFRARIGYAISEVRRKAVTHTVDNSGAGDFANIQDVIDVALSADTIEVMPGTYVENLKFRGENVFVRSTDGAEVTIIDGSQPSNPDSGSVITFVSGEDSTMVLTGFTITGGTGTVDLAAGNIRSGGGILCSNSSPTIANNIVKGNQCNEGAGIELTFGSRATISYNVIWQNRTVTNAQNYTPRGGGIHLNFGAQPLIVNNTIVANVCSTGGGGIGVEFDQSIAVIRNNIITNNVGFGISVIPGGTAEVSYSDVWNNSSGEFDGSECTSGCLSSDPLFVDAATGDFRLSLGSPCIDAGDPDETDADGSRRDMGALPVATETSVDAAEESPTQFALFQNYPNPFNPETVIRFSLPQRSEVEITIHNQLGQPVRRLATNEFGAGSHHLRWNGRNESGEIVPSGIYFYRIQANAGASTFTSTRKMVLVR